MSTLTNEQINLTYPGLVKTTDNAALDPTVEKQLTDGVGNNMPMTASQAGISFNGNLDLANATVTGLSAGGLVAGSGTNTMVSADFLTATAAIATGDGGIALGDGASCTDPRTVAIGQTASANNDGCVVIGKSTSGGSSDVVAIGTGASSNSGRSINIGRNTTAGGNGVSIGNYAQSFGNANIALTTCTVDVSSVGSNNNVLITPGGYGGKIQTNNNNNIRIGLNSSSAFAFGNTGNDNIALGTDAKANASGAVALGLQVTAAIANTVSVTELETQLAGGGVTMYSPNGTAYKLTVSDAGALVIS